tara:strand:+ start:261 stop:506 length:246 start_codon:yes stop_codon:yes gene_type:complete
MNLINIILGSVTVFVLLRVFDTTFPVAAGGGVLVLSISSLLFRKRGSTIIQEGTQVILPSENTGDNIGSEQSPFGSVRSDK